jgi:hypothetical protein
VRFGGFLGDYRIEAADGGAAEVTLAEAGVVDVTGELALR